MFSESQQYEFYVRVKQLSQKKQLPVAAVPLTSLHNAQCRQNRPLYVIYSGDPNIGKTIRKVGSCQHSFVLCPSNNTHTYNSSYQSKFRLIMGYDVPYGEYIYCSILSLTLGARWSGWSKSRPGLFTSSNDQERMVREARWAPGPVWTDAEYLASNEIRTPKRPDRSLSQYRLKCLGSQSSQTVLIYIDRSD